MQAAEENTGESENGIFSRTSESDLLRLGVPAVQIPFVRSLQTKEDLYAAEQSLPHDAFEALSWLSEGFPVDEIIGLMESGSGQKAKAPDDLSGALDSLESRKSFVIVEGEDELRKIMAEPLEKWRVFLHPTQRKIVNRSYSGAARVLGGAGTGKTVVAMHRAKALAAKCAPDAVSRGRVP